MLNQEHDQFLHQRDNDLRDALRKVIGAWDAYVSRTDPASDALLRIHDAVEEAKEVLGK